MSTVLEGTGHFARLERRKGLPRRNTDAELLGTAAAVTAALYRLNQGIALVEGSGRIRFANRLIHRLSGAGDGVRIRSGRLSGAAMPDALHFSRALKSVADGGADVALRLHRLSGKRPLVTLILSARPAGATAGSRPSGALVLIADPDRAPPPAKERLSQAYGLTASESTLAQLLVQGLALGAAAHAMNIRVTTARTHLRHVLAKTATHRQSDLVRVLLQEVAWLG
jgi:DNA-binding CsgD family transcriptional regulator